MPVSQTPTSPELAQRAEIESLRRDLLIERARNAELTEAVRQNEVFTSILAHDLRSPLGAMLTAIQLLQFRGNGDAERVFQRVAASGERMTRMVDQLLDFTRVRAGLPLEIVPADLAAVLDPIIDELRHAKPDNPIRVTYDGDLRGSWDIDRLGQVFSSLLGNASQHGTSGHGVDVLVTAHPETIEVAVHNAGVIPPELLPRVFDPLAGGQRRRGGSRGLGLGLYISRHNVEVHGGTIGVSSAPDDGTTMRVRLPRHSESVARRPQLPGECLRRSEERFQMVVENVRDYAIFMLDPEGNVVTWNRGAELLEGYTAHDIIGQHHSQFYTPEDRERRHPWKLLERAAEDGRVEDLGWRVRKDGTQFWGDVVITALRDAAGSPYGYLKVTRDLTEQRKTEELLRRNEERFRLIVDGIRDYAIFLLDPAGHVLTWNSGAELIEGYQAGEIIGEHFSRFYLPEDRADCEERLATTRTVGRYEEEGWRLRKDGSQFWANVVLTALRSPSGELLGYAKITRDLTEHNKREEERVELAKAQESIRLRDEFLAIVSHELKTPLAGLQLQIDRLLGEGDACMQPKLRLAATSSVRLAGLIETLLEVSRIATGRFELRRAPGDLVTIVEEVVESFRCAAVRAGCQVMMVADRPIPGAWDHVRIGQIVINLLANAIKYGAGRPVELTLVRRTDDVELVVRDHGPGIAAGHLPKLFGRFARAGSIRHYGGLGLGLFVVREIAVAHGGDVEATNDPSGGARIAVRLPFGADDGATREARDGGRR